MSCAMPVGMHNPLDYKVGDIVGRSIGSPREVIAKITLAAMQHKRTGKVRITDVVRKADWVTYGDVAEFYRRASNREMKER